MWTPPQLQGVGWRVRRRADTIVGGSMWNSSPHLTGIWGSSELVYEFSVGRKNLCRLAESKPCSLYACLSLLPLSFCLWMVFGWVNKNNTWDLPIVSYWCEMYCSFWSYKKHCVCSAPPACCLLYLWLSEKEVCLLVVFSGVVLGCYRLFRAELEVGSRMMVIT